MVKPTINQKEAFKKVVTNITEGKKTNLGKIMREVGYSQSTSEHPTDNLINTAGFKKLLSKIEDDKLLDKLKEIALASGDNRNSISAIKELFSLKNRYPDTKLKVDLFGEQISDLDDVE